MLERMIVLALDTTGRPGSAALMRDGQILTERRGDPARSHGERLPGEISALVAEFGLDVHAIDLYAVAAGPGSFTGLRVGIATIQGLALANGRRVVPVSALEALAFRARSAAEALIAAWIDGQRGEIFAALYSVETPAGRSLDSSTRLCELEPASVGRPDDVLAAWRGRWRDHDPIVFVGDGALVHRAIIDRALAARARIVEAAPLLAGAVAEIAVARADRGGAVTPHAIVPIYVRRSDAELARARQARP